MTKQASRSRGRRRRLEVVKRQIEPEKPNFSIEQALGYYLAEALLAVPEDYKSTPESDRAQAIAVLDSVIGLLKAIDPESAKRVAVPFRAVQFSGMPIIFRMTARSRAARQRVF